MERWHNRVAVVTGASAGIGAAVVKDLVARGMVVVGLARRKERMDELKSSLPAEQQSRFHAVKCDVSVESDIVKAFAWVDEKLGGADVLVNNAGVLKFTPITSENNTDDMRSIIDTNIFGVAVCTRQAFNSMKRRQVNDGHVLILNSISGHKVPTVPNLSLNLLVPSKHAITAMCKVLHQEFIDSGTKIKMTSISPGACRTELADEFQEKVSIPMIYMRPEDVSDAIVYCLQTPATIEISELTIQPTGARI